MEPRERAAGWEGAARPERTARRGRAPEWERTAGRPPAAGQAPTSGQARIAERAVPTANGVPAAVAIAATFRSAAAATAAAGTAGAAASVAPTAPAAALVPAAAGARATSTTLASTADPRHEFYFTRAQYTGVGRGWRRRGAWSTDFPEADRHFVYGVRRLSYVDAYQLDNPVRLDDPRLRRYPFLYAVEVGHMALTDAEVEGLRSYLEAGGFLVVDDFWGPYEWENFEYNMRRVLPGRPIVDITLDHPLYSAFYQIDEVVQVPNIGNAWRGGPTWECHGCTPHVRGIYDDAGRLMVLIHFNTDLGDAWEWADDPRYPIRYSTYAYQVGVNMIIYAMSH
ncbi:MAG TPA: DUF4159 domain-containing protein [Longimicrobiales bacterium]